MFDKLKVIGSLGFVLVFSITFKCIDSINNSVIAGDRNTVADSIPVTGDRTEARRLLIEGIQLYEEQSFVSARDAWSKSVSLYDKTPDTIGKALALNNLALAHQQLGEWQQSQKAIARSLALLEEKSAPFGKPEYWEILAKTLNTQGNWQWHTGKVEQALISWQDAVKYYDRAQDRLGIIQSSINQAKALQALGFTLRSVKILETVDRNLQQESNSQLKATGMRYLGIGYRNLGKLQESAEILQQSIELSGESQVALAWLELGNTYKYRGERVLATGGKTTAEEYFTLAMQAYQKAETVDRLALRARLNQLDLLVATGRDREAEEFLSKFDFSPQFLSNRESIYLRLNYARSLTCLKASITEISFCKERLGSPTTSKLDFQEIKSIINQAIAEAREIEDKQAEARAISQLAEIYELEKDFVTAKNLNQTALLLLEGNSAADITYRLEWQSGRMLRQQGNLAAAVDAYSQAIASLERVRENILFIDPQVQFSFRDRVEPIYREYADLLLTKPSQENLKQAIKAIDALQLAELENYLGCDLSQLITIDETTIDSTAARIYPIVLSDRLVTIVDIPGKPLSYRESLVSRSQIEQTVTSLQNNLTQPGKTPEVLRESERMYRWAISPLESTLEANPQIKTLVFVPDNLLRNIPLGILYDGERYLLEKQYAIAISPQLKLFAPAVASQPLNVLVGGIEIPQTIEGINFPEIVQVKQELDLVSAQTNANEPLLNETFTTANIKQKLQQGNFSAIHWKTHGVFSSDPAQTFLVAYQDSIKAKELQALVQTASQDGANPLELLVLSACETAKGDNRAILGLAGLTVRTGARTALSTMWRADDRATTLLMTEFYQQLERPGVTKAEALKQAQLSLLKEEGYFAPYYWGTYILVGNWL